VDHLPWVGCLGDAPALVQHLDVEETQRSQAESSVFGLNLSLLNNIA
jgi:hypothetical protein